jgi:tetratricopeptide (TPR) repeat protein
MIHRPSFVRLDASERAAIEQAISIPLPDILAGQDAYIAFRRLQRCARKTPNVWAYWYVLGDWYMQLGDYPAALEATYRCYNITAADRRSSYALATALRFHTENVDQDPAAQLKAASLAATLFLDVASTLSNPSEREAVRAHVASLQKRYPQLTPAMQTQPRPPSSHKTRHNVIVIALLVLGLITATLIAWNTLLAVLGWH